ncbi:ABC transporter substrate-binding protein [Actinoallomurus purpureus]|uniref:ABC transporter substrate-binding protein n=1 Tax=Actinoallomurus purpureus TaxID=478114 RepID=UPI00209293B0|nr:ABC transporter substrate-binding protein [Actinoallomurus purpureus]MCO6009744.1 ABC transporter substrate-binding protein [Actinoallomurus purpureus]
MRRQLPAVLAALVMAGTLAACAGKPTSDPKKLVVSTFGFGEQQFEQTVVKPFEQQTGIKVTVETGANADRLTKLRVDKNNPTTDVVMISDYFSTIGRQQGLFDKIDPAAVPNLSKIYDFAKDPAGYGPTYTYQLLGTLYRTDKVSKAEASSWQGLWDGKHKGQIAIPDISVSGGPTFLLATGQTFGTGPTDADTGFRKLKELKPDVLKFFTRSTELTSLLDRGEVVMAPGLDLFAVDLVKAGKPVAWVPPAKGRFLTANTVQLVKGAGNKAGAEKFINYLLDAGVQARAAQAYYDKPVNKGAKVPELLTKVAGDAAADPQRAGYGPADLDLIAKNRDAWIQRFAREVSG